MGLFDKKYCDVCGEKIGLLGNRKLEDGNLCKNCAAKLSPWFSERRHSTLEEIKAQLAYREENKAAVANFHTTRSLGKDMKVLLDEDAKKFMVTRAKNLEEANPDVLDFSQVTGCNLDVRESKSEIFNTVNNERKSYNPKRYEYSYDFYITIQVNHPYFDEIEYQLNTSSVHTGERSIGSAAPAAQRPAGSVGEAVLNATLNGLANTLAGQRGGATWNPDYNEYLELGYEIKAALMGAR